MAREKEKNNAKNPACVDPEQQPVLYALTDDGIAVITFNRPRKLNGWSAATIAGFQDALRRANEDVACKAAVMTGRGRYFSSGADFSGSFGLMRPSKLVKFAEELNYSIFEAFIGFSKPLVIAAQGPAVGGAVTAACSLGDYVVCSSRSTWHTPFVELGITPEGCAEYTWPLRLAPGGADDLLVQGRKMTAAEAKAVGLVDEVVDVASEDHKVAHQLLLDRGLAVARKLVREGSQRWEIVPGFRKEIHELGSVQNFVAKLRQVNRSESKRLGRAILQKPFFKAQQKFAEKRGNAGMAWTFWTLGLLQPVLSKL